ncbi:MAG: efflux RND transporter permease subunit [Planctomycetota bacterium]|jgi:HAE1 family hydrophobic/amphiphilic exporter-1
MRPIIRRILSRPVGVLVASVAVIVMGALSFLNIPLQLMPEGFESRHLSVRVRLRDSSPAEAERHVAIPIEEGLGTVAGIESISTRCERDYVRVSIELKSDADPATVERDVRDRVRRVEPDLPEDVDRVRVRRHGMSDAPIMFYACTADIDRPDLSDFVEEVMLPKLESVDGVARAGAWGLLKRSVRIWLDQEEVARRRLDLRELLTRLRGDNLASDLGDVREGGRTAFVRATMAFDSLEEIRDFPVQQGLRLGEIARVEVAPAIDEGWSRYNGNAVIVGTVYKMAGANTVETCRRVRALFEEVRERHPEIEDLEIQAFFDQGSLIENSLGTLYKNALYGGILAVIILYAFFRRLRMTLLVAAAIPLSLTIAVTVLYLGGASLNIATMMGLTLAVGMLIDNAIVVVESILRRRETGEGPREAAGEGTGEVALAVLTATLTTIAVVMPAIFLSDDTNARLWLKSIGGPIAYALLASLAVALVLVPLGSIYLRRRAGRELHASGVVVGVRQRYGRFLGGALRQRFTVVAIGILVFFSAAVPMGSVGQKGVMGRGGGPVRVFLRFPRHFRMSDANDAVKQYEEYVLRVRDELGLEGIYARFDRYGGMAMMWKTADSTTPRDELREAIREGWPRIPGVWTSLETTDLGGRTEVTLEGEDPVVLERTMDTIEERLKQLPAVTETRRERSASLQELRVQVDPEALDRGIVTPDVIRGMVGWVVRGARLRDYRAQGRDLPLLLELDPDQAVEVSDLGALLIPTGQGKKPLANLTRLTIRNASTAIERRDGRRVAEMDVVGSEEDDKRFYEQVYAELKRTKLPPGVRFEVGGSWQELQETFSALWQVLALSAVLVFLLTGILFEALLLPFTVLFTIPTALAGGVWALYLTGKPLDELALLGGILLVGIVVNNGIVLIDRVQQWRRQGLPLRSAVQAAGRDRLRPVLMTALTTIAGLLPMAVFKGGQDEIPYDTLAVAVIGGLILSTAVTLVLVPVVFTLFADLGRLSMGLLRRAT